MDAGRKMTFGKYKGQDVKYIILTHIGYIMWCLEHIEWFSLTDEEQAIYDALAIMIKKEHIEMTFPTDILYKHIKNQNLRTPFISNGNYISYFKRDADNPIIKSVIKYKTSENINHLNTNELCYCLMHEVNRQVEYAEANGETDEEIFGGW